MADVERKVKTTFDVGGNAQAAAGKLGQIMSQLGGTITRVTSMINPLNTALAALGGAMSMQKVIKVGSDFEQLQIGMAQTLKFMGQGGDTWNSAMLKSEATIQRVRTAAAALPGEAEDYAKALQLAGSNAMKATGEFDRSFNLIKDMTAVTISMGNSAELGAVMMNRMLSKNKGMMDMASDFSVKLLTAMQQLPGQAALTTKQFNEMKLDDRVKMMEQLTGQFDAMIKASGSTWEAISGAATSSFKQLFEMASKPLFESAKGSLDHVNSLLFTANGELTKMGREVVNVGKAISEGIVAAIEIVVPLVANMARQLKELADSPMVKTLTGAISGVGAALGGERGERGGEGPALGGAGIMSAIAPVIAILSGLGPVAVLLTGAFQQLFENGAAMSSIFSTFSGVVETVLNNLAPVAELFAQITGILGDLLGAVLPPLLAVFGEILNVIIPFVGEMAAFLALIAQSLRPELQRFWVLIGDLVRSIGGVLVPIIRLLISYVRTWMTVIQESIPIMDIAKQTLKLLTDQFSNTIELMKLFGIAASNAATQIEAAALRMARSGVVGSKKETGRTAPDRPAPPLVRVPPPVTPSAPGTRANATNDFRFGRFEITQKFAEGFDPDRIAVAFSQDLGKIGEQRMNSYMEPLFSGK